MESLAEHGYDYEAMLTKFLQKASKGDERAYAMAQLLVKLVPFIANNPKQDVGINQIETLVINRFESPKEVPQFDTSIEAELVPPSMNDEENNA